MPEAITCVGPTFFGDFSRLETSSPHTCMDQSHPLVCINQSKKKKGNKISGTIQYLRITANDQIVYGSYKKLCSIKSQLYYYFPDNCVAPVLQLIFKMKNTI